MTLGPPTGHLSFAVVLRIGFVARFFDGLGDGRIFQHDLEVKRRFVGPGDEFKIAREFDRRTAPGESVVDPKVNRDKLGSGATEKKRDCSTQAPADFLDPPLDRQLRRVLGPPVRARELRAT